MVTRMARGRTCADNGPVCSTWNVAKFELDLKQLAAAARLGMVGYATRRSVYERCTALAVFLPMSSLASLARIADVASAGRCGYAAVRGGLLDGHFDPSTQPYAATASTNNVLGHAQLEVMTTACASSRGTTIPDVLCTHSVYLLRYSKIETSMRRSSPAVRCVYVVYSLPLIPPTGVSLRNQPPRHHSRNIQGEAIANQISQSRSRISSGKRTSCW